MVRMIAGTALCIGLAMAPMTQAQVNKCVDANGKTVYSQAPCPANTKSSTLRKLPPPPTPVMGADAKAGSAKPAGPKTAAELEQDFRKRRAEADAAGKKAQEELAEAKVREENCRSSKGQLASLESGTRQVRMNEAGERTTLNDEQVAHEVERTRQAVQSWCK